jgi:hypothetical protein
MDYIDEIESRDLGIIQTMVTDFEKNCLPWLLRLKNKADQNIAFSDADIDFLAKVLEDSNRTLHLAVKDPVSHEICNRIVSLHTEISSKAFTSRLC